MKESVFDLWSDLREKRLWPIAVLLAVALVGVPVLLLKSPPEKAAPPTASGGSQTSLPIVSPDGSSIAGSSTLGAFGAKDPFRPRIESPPGSPTADGTATGAGGEAAGDLTGGLEGGAEADAAGAGSGGDSAGSDPASEASTGGSGGGSAETPAEDSGSGGTDPGSGSGGSPSPTPSPAPSPGEAKYYEYAVDVELGPIGNERRYRDVRALDMLPNDRDPVVVYLGQTRDNESSFLVNQRFAHGVEGETSEGTCLPKRDCNFVYLRTDNRQDDHYFTERAGDKREFHLKLIAVNRKLDSRDASGSSEPPSSERRAKTRGAKSNREVRRTAFDFRIPLIAGRRR